MEREGSRSRTGIRWPVDGRGKGEAPSSDGVPRWPAAVALLAIGVAYSAVSDRLTLGQSSLLLVVVVVLLVLLLPVHLLGYRRLTRVLALSLVATVTVAVAASTVVLVSLLPHHQNAVPPPRLLRDAALIWAANVVTFAVWYWEIDGGGPARRRRDTHESEDFLFPQMNADARPASGWHPDFLDYLFLAFNHSTAFSPTDTAVLSRRAKVLVMIQATLSLMTIAVLAAKAINNL